jgi:thiamine pyrophosphate-dependent acetolactate synthase large subunit-like protein
VSDAHFRDTAGCHGVAAEPRELSDRLKAPSIHPVKSKGIVPYDDPRWMGDVGMIGTKAVCNAVNRKHYVHGSLNCRECWVASLNLGLCLPDRRAVTPPHTITRMYHVNTIIGRAA